MYIFFDTETTGVNKSSDRVVQLAWLIATASGRELRRQNFLIKPSGYEIPTTAEKIHGISTSVASRFGVPLRHALLEFSSDVDKCQVIVAHNLSFDLAMLRPEFDRENIIWRLDEKLMVCTMRASTNWCRLSKLDGRSGYKWPKLDELHYRLFGRYFENAHDALNDVLATKDCFFELNKRKIIVDPLIGVKAESSKEIKREKISKNFSECTKLTSSTKSQRSQSIFSIKNKNKNFRTVQSVSLRCRSCGEAFSVTLRRYERSASCPKCFAAVSSQVYW